MDGIEILKNIRKLELETKVIFISGFQDFEYARNALTFGAVEYLLKPVILEELIHAIGKAAEMLNGGSAVMWQGERPGSSERVEDKEEDKVLVTDLEETTYLPVLAELLFDGTESEQVKKLVYFSFQSFLEEWLGERKLGILFSKNQDVIMVMKLLS